uniref:WAP domain-containing protein n=1 Tax=Anas platyrhynchos TaxID=8839 RepID=A0A8B9SSC4_ANAPL
MGAGCAAPLLQKTRVHLPACTGTLRWPRAALLLQRHLRALRDVPLRRLRGQPQQLRDAGSSATRRAWDTEKPKPGECPAGLPGLLGPCQEECGGDSDCPGSQKCCNSSCGNQCLPPAPARKAGFCPASAGLFPSYDCRERCQRDADCPGAEKCCLRGCDSMCLRPARGWSRQAPCWAPITAPRPPSRTASCLAEKPGICPLTEAAPWTQAPCQASCAEDGQCPGDEKCCSSRRCGRVCLAPERDKPGQCPKVRPRQAPELCTEEDACGHDRDCPRQEKCCFGGCAMRCTRPAREHPGECPRAEPCGDPRQQAQEPVPG